MVTYDELLTTLKEAEQRVPHVWACRANRLMGPVEPCNCIKGRIKAVIAEASNGQSS